MTSESLSTILARISAACVLVPLLLSFSACKSARLAVSPQEINYGTTEAHQVNTRLLHVTARGNIPEHVNLEIEVTPPFVAPESVLLTRGREEAIPVSLPSGLAPDSYAGSVRLSATPQFERSNRKAPERPYPVTAGRIVAIPDPEPILLFAEVFPPRQKVSDYARVEVFFATDRERSRSSEPAEVYSGEFANIRYGTSVVTIPRDHRVGNLEGTMRILSVITLEFRKDPRRHVYLESVEELAPAQFWDRLAEVVETRPERELLVFLHGYATSFEEAMRRTAQLTYDLGFPGVPFAYSWPSDGCSLPPWCYTRDEADLQRSLPHLKRVIGELTNKSGADRIHIIAHSLGARGLFDALREIALEDPSFPHSNVISNIVLAAPDIDSERFQRGWHYISNAAERITLYASSKDKPLDWSALIHGLQRLGKIGPKIVILEGMDTIDVGEADMSFLAHSYFAERRSVVYDIFNLIRNNLPPGRRPGLERMTTDEGMYWRFLP